ncbi:MAG: aminoglycoside phosphotransferase [Acidimicrobiales bacterium]|nr:aminoglycoside phosphotransferase [Acidimicrobiales bacterium]
MIPGPLASLANPLASGLAEARARLALAELGVPPSEPLLRADSVTNEVWLTEDYVVRVNRTATMRLKREALLASVLPAEVGYPPVIQYGGEAGADWLVVGRVPGTPLSRCWPQMSRTQRRRATTQLAQRMAAVHATICPRLSGLVDTPHLLDPRPTGREAVARLCTAIDEAARLTWVDAGIMGDLARLVAADADNLDPFDVPTIVHGDLTFENILWDGEQITALLDFEFARPGPPDLDLDVLLRFVAHPHLHVAPDYEHLTHAEDYAEVPFWLAEDYPELFSDPRQFARMRLYSIAWDVKEVLAYPPPRGLLQLNACHPLQRLVQVLRGTSYLDRLNGSVQIDF